MFASCLLIFPTGSERLCAKSFVYQPCLATAKRLERITQECYVSAIEDPSRKQFSYEECLRLEDSPEKQKPSWSSAATREYLSLGDNSAMQGSFLSWWFYLTEGLCGQLNSPQEVGSSSDMKPGGIPQQDKLLLVSRCRLLI